MTHEENKPCHLMVTYDACRRCYKAWAFRRGTLQASALGNDEAQALTSVIAAARLAERCDRETREQDRVMRAEHAFLDKPREEWGHDDHNAYAEWHRRAPNAD